MLSRRKACTNCTTSKRKCVVQKPKCTRCSQKNLEYPYDLEPLNQPPTNSEKLLAFGFNESNCNSLGLCIMKTLTLRAPGTDPAICALGCENAPEIIRLGFDTVPQLIGAKKPTTFVHPMLQLPGVYDHFKVLVEKQEKGVSCEDLKRLIQINIGTVSSKEVLTALQALLIHLAASIFSSCPAEREKANRSLSTLSEWTQILLACAEAGMPKGQSLWQD